MIGATPAPMDKGHTIPSMTTIRFTLPSAVHLFLFQGDQVLLLLRQNTGYEDGNFSVIAGHLEGDETVIAAAMREAAEEAGIRLQAEDIEVVGVMHRREDDERIDWFLTATRWSGSIKNMEPEKCADLRWSALNQLPANIIPYVRRALENFQQGRWFEAFGW